MKSPQLPNSWIDRRLSRRSFLRAASSVLASALPWRRAHAKQRTAVMLGLSAPTYYNGFCPFLNWWKQAAPIDLHLSDGRTLAGRQAWETGNYLNPQTGELLAPALPEISAISRIFFTNTTPFQVEIGCDYSGEEFTLVWNGQATGKIDFLTAGGSQTMIGSNQIDFVMGSSPGNTSITLAVANRNDPPRDVRVFQKRYAQNVRNGEIFNPDWLAEIRKFTDLRLLEWQAINGSAIDQFSQLAGIEYDSWCQPFTVPGSFGEHGPKGSIHPHLLCELANVTGCKIHVCIPDRATDEFVESFAEYLRAHTNEMVTFEFSNECWNTLFAQTANAAELGRRKWPDKPHSATRYYGHRAAECMSIIRHVYSDRSRWRGAIATQTVNTEMTRACFDGIEAWRSETLQPPNSLAVKDLFDSLYVTGYFGDVTGCTQPTAISRSNPAAVNSPSHGYVTGQVVRPFVAEGMVELNNKRFVVTKVDDDSYTLNCDSTNYGDYVSGTRNYVAPSILFDLMEESASKHLKAAKRYPTKYTFFSQQLSASLRSGICQFGFETVVNLSSLRRRHWPEQLKIARANGLTLRQYEGGCHFVGDAYLAGFGGNSMYLEYLLHHAHSPQAASVYRDMYKGFSQVGGECPSKFVADGAVGQYGTWAGIRFWPTVANDNRSDIGNPVWQATLEAKP